MDPRIILEEAGLAGNEAKVYLALIDLGSALAGEITKKSGVNRTNVYDALDRLIEKGLVSYVVAANRKYFEAAPPKRIINYLDEKEALLRKKKSLVNHIVAYLESRRKLSKEPQEATVFRGKKGIKSIAEDILRTKKEMLTYGAQGYFMQLMQHYAVQWHNKRVELKIPVRIIYNEKVRKLKSKLNFKFLTKRYNSTIYNTPASTWIYGDKIAIIVWSDQPIATMIRSKEVANSYRQFFNILWKDSKV